MILKRIQNSLVATLNGLGYEFSEFEVEFTNIKFGDVTTNVAMRLASKAKKNPHQLAKELVLKLKQNDTGIFTSIDVAGPGFINFSLSDDYLINSLNKDSLLALRQQYKGKSVVVEYSDPNPFKALHAGHLYTTIIGNALANMLREGGAEVHRVNFGGDVGPHVARAMWGILHEGSQGTMSEADALQYTIECQGLSIEDRAKIVASHYVQATAASETSETAKKQITEINKRVYQLHSQNDLKSDFAQIYWMWRDWSYEYFRAFYAEIEVEPFEKYYPESQTVELGTKKVAEQLKQGVFEKSDGAVVFRGEKYGLHTRVFINSHGLPTYETKDVGLSLAKWNDYKFNKSIIITGDDIEDYMKVVLKSIEQFNPQLSKLTEHITHGQVKLAGGKKMSSRRGNVLYASDVLDSAHKEALNNPNTKDKTYAKKVAYNAVKYSFLKQGVGGDIIYDPQDSLAMNGDSSTYLLYSLARANSIIQKAPNPKTSPIISLDEAERDMYRLMIRYIDSLDSTIVDLEPHSLCSYLFELTQAFNSFYEKNKVLGHVRENQRLHLINMYAIIMKRSLKILSISSVEKL